MNYAEQVKIHGSIRKAARENGIPYSTFCNRLKQEKESFEVDSTDDTQVITGNGTVINTLEDVLAIANVNLDVWEVERYVINKWDVGAKDKNKEVKTTPLWQVKVWLKRKIPKSLDSAFDRIVENLGNWKPIQFPVPTNNIRKKRHLLEIALFDAHFGKLAWGVETGTDYNSKIASTLFQNAADDLLDRATGYNIEQILFPIGNDFFNVNNWRNTTEHGTQQDVDSRMSRIFEIGCQAFIRCIERCLMVAPVNVIWVPGNHDPETSWYLSKFIEAWYRNVSEVRVNKDPTHRKYVGYGVNLIGFTHGNEEAHHDLPLIMATENPELWAKATNRVWHLGHLHKKKEARFNAGDTYNGVSVHVIPSLSATDAWHYKKGYVKGSRAAEAWLWSHEEGYVGHFSANARE